MTFTPVSGGETFTLESVKVSGMDPDQDSFQLLDSNTTEPLVFYSYFSKEYGDELAKSKGKPEGFYDECVGWWDQGMAGEDPEEFYRGDDPINVGQGFLGLIVSGENLVVTPNGEVPTVPTSISTDSNESPFICNYLPVDMIFSDIKADNMDPDQDSFQLLDSNTTEPLVFYSYFSKEYGDELAKSKGKPEGFYDECVGWWDQGMAGEDPEEFYRGDDELPAGASFLGLIVSGEDITLNFPDATHLPSQAVK